AFDNDGRLIACEHRTRRISRSAGDAISVVVDRYQGKRLNSPNDVIVAKDGSILFTDPLYGLRDGLGGPGEQEISFQGVYRVAPGANEPTLLVDDFEAPNGLALSHDETILYIADTIRRHIRTFKVGDDWTLSGGDILVELKGEEEGKPDGMKLDVKGNIFSTGPGGIWICNPDGDILGRIKIPEKTSNLAWGGTDYSSLYVTASTGLYKIRCLTSGS
ncbi:MAG: SMP-30/gluconolactonase/LRE family protein, partial [Anaerolineales bacterium]